MKRHTGSCCLPALSDHLLILTHWVSSTLLRSLWRCPVFLYKCQHRVEH